MYIEPILTHQKRSNKISDSIRPKVLPNMIITMVLIAIGITPILGYMVPNSVKLVVFLLWVMTLFFFHVFSGKEKGFGIVKWFVIFWILQILYCIIGISSNILVPFSRCYIYVIPLAIVYIKNYYNLKEIKFLWFFFTILICANLISNIYIGLTGGDMAFRIDRNNANTNAGSTAFVVGCMLLIMIFWIVFRKSVDRFLRFFSVLIMAGMLYYILFLNTRATSLIILLFMVLGFYIVEFGKKGKQSNKELMLRMIIVALLILLIVNPILNIMSSIFYENTRMMSRLNDISFVAAGNGDVQALGEGSLYGRSLLWQTSIDTFLYSVPNFLFGIGEIQLPETDFFSLLRSGVGNHSEFLDLAARYGLVGIIIYIFIIKHTISFFYSLTNDLKMKNYVFVLLLGLFVFCFVNNLSLILTTMLIIYIMLPITIILIENKKI